jgi:hypothetical protein
MMEDSNKAAELTDQQIRDIAKDYGWNMEVGELYFPDDALLDFARAIAALSAQSAEIARLKAELEVTNGLLEERDKLLRAIPECDIHGPCIPHAMEWIAEARKDGDRLDHIEKGICYPAGPKSYYVEYRFPGAKSFRESIDLDRQQQG